MNFRALQKIIACTKRSNSKPITYQYLVSLRFLRLLTIAACAAVVAFSRTPPGADMGPILLTQGSETSQPLQNFPDREKSQLETIADKAVRALVPSTNQVAADVVRVHHPIVYVRYRLDWVEFIDRVRLERSVDPANPDAFPQILEQIRPNLQWSLLGTSIITEKQANAALRSCHPKLFARIEKPRPPFFNNRTGVQWSPKKDHLALEAAAVIDAAKNQCVKAIVDLRTGRTVCNANIVCFVR